MCVFYISCNINRDYKKKARDKKMRFVFRIQFLQVKIRAQREI